ncbi:MAG: serine/threonine protein kinase, partial [Kiritimatiellae bacterium]|nr:serine/threonine protein kinase [Kiritimatiellia bacterium]
MLKPGDRFGDYTVVRLLGQGGMGAVFLLENAEGGQIAAKILDPATAKDHEARKRFLREAQLALGVKHPNLVETYDVGEDPETGLCYILMEYVPGGDLAGRIEQEGALQISEATRIAYEIASVLELARQKGIVHRDIKPANIMFGADGKAKLADLGIARSGFGGAGMTTVTQTGMMIGTPAYMAPEQMLDAHNVDCRADIYSLGIVFYEMLTGERPNKDDTVVQLMAKALKGEPLPDVRTLRPEVSASLAQLLNMMVAPDKDGRISTPWQIMGALDIIARGGKFGVKTAVIADGRARTAS